MGVTWKYDTMFNSAFTESNLQELFYNARVETIAVDYEPTDTYESLVEDVNKISSEVDYIMGYSFGCLLAVATAQKNTKGIILLDANSLGGNGGKNYIENVETANNYFEKDLAVVNKKLKDIPEKLIINPYKPKTFLIFSDYGNKNNNLCTHGMYLRALGKVNKTVIKHSSHYIMIEPARFELAKEILGIMNEHNR
jgi:hypothetical protein